VEIEAAAVVGTEVIRRIIQSSEAPVSSAPLSQAVQVTVRTWVKLKLHEIVWSFLHLVSVVSRHRERIESGVRPPLVFQGSPLFLSVFLS